MLRKLISLVVIYFALYGCTSTNYQSALPAFDDNESTVVIETLNALQQRDAVITDQSVQTEVTIAFHYSTNSDELREVTIELVPTGVTTNVSSYTRGWSAHVRQSSANTISTTLSSIFLAQGDEQLISSPPDEITELTNSLKALGWHVTFV